MGKKRRRKNKGWFRPGFDPRRHTGFTTEACKKGFEAARQKCMGLGAETAAWFFRKVRGFYQEKRREAGGELPESDNRCPGCGGRMATDGQCDIDCLGERGRHFGDPDLPF